MAEGDKAIEGTDRSSLRILGSWASQLTRKRGKPVLEKNRQQECSGGRYLVADRNRRFHDHPELPGATELKAGSASICLFGVQPALVDNEGNPLEGATEAVVITTWRVRRVRCLAITNVSADLFFHLQNKTIFSGDASR